MEAGYKEIEAARKIAHQKGPIAQILDNMAPQGYWVKPGTVYTPKCRGTVWSIISLAQLGASVEEDKRISTACDYLMDNALAGGGQFSSTGEAFKTFNCLQGNLLTSLMDLGCRDSRLEVAFEWTARTVTGAGLPLKVSGEGLPAVDAGFFQTSSDVVYHRPAFCLPQYPALRLGGRQSHAGFFASAG